MTADQVVWSEQGRLHLSYKGKVASTSSGLDSTSTILIQFDIDEAEGNDLGISNSLSIVNKIINDHNGELLFHPLDNGAKIEINFKI